MSEWQPIETAPKDGSVILIAVDPELQRAGYLPPVTPMRFEGGQWCWSVEREFYGYTKAGSRFLTHWMPLPTAPDNSPS